MPTDCLASTSEVSDVCESVDLMTNHRQTNNATDLIRYGKI